jgi:hypothetical protein
MNELLRVSIASIFVFAAGCSDKPAKSNANSKPSTPPTTLTEIERSVLKTCSDGLPSMTIDPTGNLHITRFVEECGSALGYAPLAEADAADKEKVIAASGFFCKPDLEKRATKKRQSGQDEAYDTALLFNECGAAYYGLEQDQSEYLSLSWFFFQRTAAWVLDTRKKLLAEGSSDADKALYKALDTRLRMFRPAVPSHQQPNAVGIITPGGAAIAKEAEPDPSICPNEKELTDWLTKVWQVPAKQEVDVPLCAPGKFPEPGYAIAAWIIPLGLDGGTPLDFEFRIEILDPKTGEKLAEHAYLGDDDHRSHMGLGEQSLQTKDFDGDGIDEVAYASEGIAAGDNTWEGTEVYQRKGIDLVEKSLKDGKLVSIELEERKYLRKDPSPPTKGTCTLLPEVWVRELLEIDPGKLKMDNDIEYMCFYREDHDNTETSLYLPDAEYGDFENAAAAMKAYERDLARDQGLHGETLSEVKSVGDRAYWIPKQNKLVVVSGTDKFELSVDSKRLNDTNLALARRLANRMLSK